MAVRFSAVTVTANDQKCNLLVGGVPTSYDDLEGWTIFENFLEKNEDAEKVNVQVDTYLYREGEIVDATPEEVAYFMKRQEMQSDFLEDRCSNLGVLNYDIDVAPNKSFGMEMN